MIVIDNFLFRFRKGLYIIKVLVNFKEEEEGR